MFQANRIGLDEVTLELNQVGKNETEVNLKHPLLDDKKNYHFCVDNLQIPLNLCPIFDLTDVELFRIERRNVGEALTVANIDANLPFTVPINPFYDVGAFVAHMSNWARQFEDYVTTGLGLDEELKIHGINAADFVDVVITADTLAEAVANGFVGVTEIEALHPRTEEEVNDFGRYDLLSFSLLADMSLQINGSKNFWNNYFISFSRIGAELLGISNSLETVQILGLLAAVEKNILYVIL